MPLLLVALGAALPLLIAPGLSFHYDTVPKLVWLLLVTACVALRVQGLPAEWAALWSRTSGRVLVMLCGTLVIWSAIVTAVSTRPSISFFGSAWRGFGFVALFALAVAVTLVAAHLSAHADNIHVLLRGAAIAAIAASLYGVAQYFDFDPFQNAAGYHALDGDHVVVRPPGTLGHADYFGWWLAVEFFCALAVAREENSVWRIIGMAAAALTAFCTALTGTRAALLSLAAGVIVWLFLTRPRIRARHFIAIGAVAIVFGAFLLAPPGARLRNRIAWSLHEPTGGGRPLLWRDALRMAASHPLTGYGPETFSAAFGSFESEDLAHLLPDFHYESPHNLALDALTSGGVPALLIALAFGALAIRAAARARSPVRSILAAALAASFVASLFSAAMLAPVLLTGLVVAILIASEPASPAPSVRVAPVAAFAVPLAVVLIVAAGAFAISEFRLAQFQANPTAAGYVRMTGGLAPVLHEDIYASRILSEICPKVAAPPERFECWRVATVAAGNATRTADDTANAWYNLAIFTALHNDVTGTRATLLEASRISPNWFKPHWILAELCARQGNLSEARAEAQRAVRLDAAKNREVIATSERLSTEQTGK